MSIHTLAVLTFAVFALSLVLRLMRLGMFLRWPRAAVSAREAADDFAWALVSGVVAAFAAWLLAIWE